MAINRGNGYVQVVDLEDMIDMLAVLDAIGENAIHGVERFLRERNPFSGFMEQVLIGSLGQFGIVVILVHVTDGSAFTAITGERRFFKLIADRREACTIPVLMKDR